MLRNPYGLLAPGCQARIQAAIREAASTSRAGAWMAVPVAERRDPAGWRALQDILDSGTPESASVVTSFLRLYLDQTPTESGAAEVEFWKQRIAEHLRLLQKHHP